MMRYMPVAEEGPGDLDGEGSGEGGREVDAAREVGARGDVVVLVEEGDAVGREDADLAVGQREELGAQRVGVARDDVDQEEVGSPAVWIVAWKPAG
jgi:hypothetical protein